MIGVTAAGQISEPKPVGNVKVTRSDWLSAAMSILVRDGVEAVKVLNIANQLGVSRSSFYWYFRDRGELLDALLERWEQQNTGVIQHFCALPSDTIAEAVLNLFRSFISEAFFDARLDFAIREWARRSDDVRAVLDRSDATRLDAIAAMFARHGYGPEAAAMRARVLYYMQIGYYALELNEDLPTRLALVPGYIEGSTGQMVTQAEMTAFEDAVQRQLAGETE